MKRHIAMAVCVSALGCARSGARSPTQAALPAQSAYRVEAPEALADPRNPLTRPAEADDVLGAVALASTRSFADALGYTLKGFKFVAIAGPALAKAAAEGTASALHQQLCSTPRAPRVLPAHVLAATAEGPPTLVLDSTDLPGVGAVRLEMGQRDDGKVDVAVLASGAVLCQGDAWSLTADGVAFSALPEAPNNLGASVTAEGGATVVARAASTPWMVGHPWRAGTIAAVELPLHGVVLRQELSPVLVRALLSSREIVLTVGGGSVRFEPRKSSVVQDFVAQLR